MLEHDTGHQMKLYRGRRLPDGISRHVDTASEVAVEIVEADGSTRSLDLWLDLRNHSPTGFAWGYCGSGPAQLALAILADAIGEVAAQIHYQDFKNRYVAAWGDSWEISLDAVRDWFASELRR